MNQRESLSKSGASQRCRRRAAVPGRSQAPAPSRKICQVTEEFALLRPRTGALQNGSGARMRSRDNARGYTLIEMLVYMSVAFLILGFAYAAMYKSMDASAGIRRNANDISSALSAGEHWREDVRHATAPLHVEKTSEDGTTLHIPQHQGEVAYRFSSNEVARRSGGGDWTPVLEHVKDSDFVADQRQKALAWRWEVELQSYRKAMTRMRPLFTFIAVPTPSAK